MRYSRFRATVTGTESQKRNRVDGKARVSKSKGKSGSVKPDDTRIKQENSQNGAMSQYSPMSMSAASPYLGDNGDDFNARFLTPCSDDMAQGLAINPAMVDARRHPPTDFSSPLDFMNNPSHPYSPTFSAFDDATIDMSTFSADSNTSNFADCSSDWADRLQPHF